MTLSKLVLLLLLSLVVITGLANGMAEAEEDELNEYIQRLNQVPSYQAEQNESSLVKSFLKMLFALIIVIAIAVFSLRFLKRFMSLTKESSWVQVLAYDSIGSNKGICIAKIADRTLVLGVTDSSINLLTELTNEEVETIGYSLGQKEESGFSTAGRQDNNYGFHSHLQSSINKIQALNSELKKQIKGDG
ncbi:MAG: FliO/MopB family protein [Clostridia bacterium]|nr:FliO/MopB family protein [Clostridia bacterium]